MTLTDQQLETAARKLCEERRTDYFFLVNHGHMSSERAYETAEHFYQAAILEIRAELVRMQVQQAIAHALQPDRRE